MLKNDKIASEGIYKSMYLRVTDFCKYSFVFAMCTLMSGASLASQTTSARSTTNVVTGALSRGDVSRGVMRGAGTSDVVSRNAAKTSRATTSVTARAITPARTGIINARTPGALRIGKMTTTPVGRVATVSRAATNNVARGTTTNRSAALRGTSAVSGASRAGISRATAVFDDVSKIGGGYATCRDAYSTCMDQFCAKANDTFRRCFCSSRYTEFRNTEEALNQAKLLLMKFEDNNLNAVDKTAAEVNAMYTASVGEAAIKNDTSGAAQILSEVSDLLAGKKKVETSTQNTSGSIGTLNLDFSTDVDDIWGGDSDSIFNSSGSSVDLSTLEGQDLYNQASKQCQQMVKASCENDAAFNMSKSSYSILITQDCNAYQKKVDSQREAVQQTVRTAEKYLRQARLEEYRAHNSQDVNECITKVRTAMLADTACGASYNRCLDYSGVYINPVNGEPVYSQRLFQMVDLITLDGTGDVLGQNPNFNEFLDERRMFANTALDTCRDKAELVWTEFKRSAIIEISQAQDAKLEKVKSSCVDTIKKCYDTKSASIKETDTTNAQTSAALGVYVTKAMCQEQVSACASLYGDTDGCTFDGNGKLITGNNGKRCGMTSLLAYVDAVDQVRVAEGCESAIDTYLQQQCKPTTGDKGYPWKCRTKQVGNIDKDEASSDDGATLAANIKRFAMDNCGNPDTPEAERIYTNNAYMPAQTRTQIARALAEITEQLEYMLMDECEERDGYWLEKTDTSGTPLASFYKDIYNGDNSNQTWGRCVENTTMLRCLAYNTETAEDTETKTDTDGETGTTTTTVATASYDLGKDECTFSDSWFKEHCTLLGNGYYEGGICYIENK